MSKKTTDWYKYEELAAIIYSKLEPDAIVKHDDSIYGHITERNRQIDVSIRTSVAGHEILVIVDAKDRKSAPDVNTIGTFAEIMRDVSASRGVIVCRKRPNDANIKYAKKHGIDICTAIDINDHKWNEQIQIPLIVQSKEFRVTVMNQTIRQAGPMNFHTPDKWQLSDGVSQLNIADFVLKLLNDSDISTGHHVISYIGKGIKIFLGGEGLHPFDFALAINCYTKSLFRYCTPTQFKALKNYSTGKINITNLNIDNLPPLDNSDEWINASDVEINALENFLIQDCAIYDLGFFNNNNQGKPIIQKKSLTYYAK